MLATPPKFGFEGEGMSYKRKKAERVCNRRTVGRRSSYKHRGGTKASIPFFPQRLVTGLDMIVIVPWVNVALSQALTCDSMTACAILRFHSDGYLTTQFVRPTG